MLVDKLQEVGQKVLGGHHNLEAKLSWWNGFLAVNAEDGIHVLKLSADLRSFSKAIDFCDCIIETPKMSPVSNMLQFSHLNNLKLTEMFLDPALWPHHTELSESLTFFINFEWSPKAFTYPNEGIIAAITNTGTLEMYALCNNTWCAILNLTNILYANYDTDKIPTKYGKVFGIVKELQTTALCWGAVSDCKKYAYFVSGQGNSDILFWMMENSNVSVMTKLVLRHSTKGSQISHLYWIPVNKNKAILIYANVEGELFGLVCVLYNNCVEVQETVVLWKYKDKMSVTNLVSISVKTSDLITIVFSKHRHLVTILFNTNICNVILKSTHNPADDRILFLKQLHGTFYFATESYELFSMKLTIINDNINIAYYPIVISDLKPNTNIHSVAFSENGVLWAIAISNNKVNIDKTESPVSLKIYCSCDENIAFRILQNNPQERLTNVQDCIQVLRYLAVKNYALPSLDYVKFCSEAKDNAYRLKLYLIILKLYLNIEPYLCKYSTHFEVPERSVEKLHDWLLIKQVQRAIDDIYQKYKKNTTIDHFDAQALVFIKDFSALIFKKYEIDISLFSNMNLLNNITYKMPTVLCQCCNEPYNGEWYGSNHFNMFCTLSFTPINNDEYLCCPNCNCTARIEYISSHPQCVFCDSYLIKK